MSTSSPPSDALQDRPQLTVREAADADVGPMAALERTAFSDPWSAEAFRSLLRQAHARCTLAMGAEGDLRGYCVLLHVADEGEIANIAVAAPWRGHGIAGRLLDDALEAATRYGVARVFLEVRESNAPARRLYASRGFQQIGRRTRYYQAPTEDALVLERRQSTSPAAMHA